MPTVTSNLGALYRAALREVIRALGTRRALGLPSEPADVKRVLTIGSNRKARMMLEENL